MNAWIGLIISGFLLVGTENQLEMKRTFCLWIRALLLETESNRRQPVSIAYKEFASRYRRISSTTLMKPQNISRRRISWASTNVRSIWMLACWEWARRTHKADSLVLLTIMKSVWSNGLNPPGSEEIKRAQSKSWFALSCWANDGEKLEFPKFNVF